MREDTAVEASKNIVLPEAEAAQLAMLKATTDPEVCVTTAKQYLKTIERRHECSVLSDRAILRLSGLDPDSMDAPDHLYALFRTLPLQTVSKSSPEHTVLTALTRSLCAPPESDEVAHVNIDLIGVYLATLAEAVQYRMVSQQWQARAVARNLQISLQRRFGRLSSRNHLDIQRKEVSKVRRFPTYWLLARHRERLSKNWSQCLRRCAMRAQMLIIDRWRQRSLNI
jgi:hypothetical protein